MDSVDLSFGQELRAVDKQLQQEIYFKAGAFEELVHLSLDELGHHLNPAIVLAVSKACGYVGDQNVRLASIVQYVYVADQVHGLVHDEQELPEENRQFPVLVGDAVYGNFFLGLCRGQMLRFLAPLAEVICTINEGAISRWKIRGRELDIEQRLVILEQETASLTSRAARLSAELAGADGAMAQQFEEFGRWLGMAWAAYEEKLPSSMVTEFAGRAGKIIAQLPEGCNLTVLDELYDYLCARILPEAGYVSGTDS